MPPRPRSDRGAAAVEYGLLIAGVVGALVLSVTGLQAGLATAYRATSSSIGATPPAGPAAASSSSATPTPTTSAPAAAVTSPAAAPTTPPTAESGPATTSSPAAPSPPAATPAPSPTGPAAPASAFTVAQDETVTMDVLASGTSKTGTPRVTPASAGRVSWKGTRLVLAADEDAVPGLVTVVYQYKKGSTVYTDTVVVRVTPEKD